MCDFVLIKFAINIAVALAFSNFLSVFLHHMTCIPCISIHSSSKQNISKSIFIQLQVTGNS